MGDLLSLLRAWLEADLARTLNILAGILALLAVYTVYLHVRLYRVLKRLGHLLRGAEGAKLEELLVAQHRQLAQVQEALAQLRKDQADLRHQLRARVLSPSVVRYQAFAHTGGDQSFSLALLDSEANGAVLTALHGRTECRVYAKPVVKGQSHYPLTAEEQQVIRTAREQLGLQ